MIDEPELLKVPLHWATTWETGVNPRTLQRFLNNGWVEYEQRSGKRYWRLKRATDTKSTEKRIG